MTNKLAGGSIGLPTNFEGLKAKLCQNPSGLVCAANVFDCKLQLAAELRKAVVRRFGKRKVYLFLKTIFGLLN